MIVFFPDVDGVTYNQYWQDKDPSDPGGRELWRKFRDSSGVKPEGILGKLILKDRWDVRDTIPKFKILALSFSYSLVVTIVN